MQVSLFKTLQTAEFKFYVSSKAVNIVLTDNKLTTF